VKPIIVPESDSLGQISYLSDIENLVSFTRARFEDYSFKYKKSIIYVTTISKAIVFPNKTNHSWFKMTSIVYILLSLALLL